MDNLNEVYCDLNARMTTNEYSLERNGSVRDLKILGYSLKSALGIRFRFYMDDADDDGSPNDIMFDGTVAWSKEFGYLAKQESVIFWRKDIKIDLLKKL